MRADFLVGRTVVDHEANIVGELSGIEIEVQTWRMTGLWVELDNDSIPALGYKKPRFRGKVEVHLPVYTVHAISDIVSLNKNHEEIKQILHSESPNQ